MRLPVTVALLALAASPLAAQTRADSAAIRAAALDYAEGWDTGDSTRMARAVHPDLAKRIVRTDSTGKSRLGSMTAAQLVGAAGKGYGKETPPARQLKTVEILSITNGAASVKLTMSDWVDYMHLGRWNGEWKIVNVLWEMTAP